MAFNEYDEMLSGGKPAEGNQYDSLANQAGPVKDVLKSSMFAAKDADPARKVNVLKLSEKTKLPEPFVDRNYDQLSKKQAEFNDYDKLIEEAPSAAQWLEKPDNAQLGKNDIEGLKNVDKSVQRFKPYEADPVTIHKEYLGAAKGGFNQLATSAYLLGAAYGKTDPKAAAEQIAEFSKRQQGMSEAAPSYVKEFQKTLEKEGGDVNRAWQSFLGTYDEYKKGNAKEAFRRFKDLGSTVGETLDLAYESLVNNPRAVGYMTIESLANSFPSLITGAAGGAAGAATPIPGAGLVGFAGGTFAGSAMVEIGATIQQELSERNIDVSNPEALAAALQDPQLMATIRSRAERKGLTTAAVDAMFSLFAGQIVGKAGKGLTKKAAAVVADVGLQATGEAASEFAGQVAKEGGDLSKVNLGDAIAEGIISLGHSVGETVIGGSKAAVSQMRERYSKSVDKAVEQVTDDTAKAMKTLKDLEALDSASQEIEKLKNVKEVPSKVKELIDIATGGDEGAAVYFQKDDWDNYWNKKGKSPSEEAARIAGDQGKSYMEAGQTGDTIEVPVGKFLASQVGQTDSQDIIQITRTAVDGPTLEEARQHMQELPGLMENLADEALGVPDEGVTVDTEAEAKTIASDVAEQLKTTGMKDREARVYAKVYEGVFNSMAERTGKSARELYDQYGLKIRGPEQMVQLEAGQSVLEQAGEKPQVSDLGFYSKLEKQVIDKLQGKSAEVGQVQAILRDLKPEEVKWSGIEEFLKGKKKVDRQELLDFIRANSLQITEVTLADREGSIQPGDRVYTIFSMDGEGGETYFDLQRAEAAAKEDYGAGNYEIQEMEWDGETTIVDAEQNEATFGKPKFAQYTLPGGENYREVLLTMPPTNELDANKYQLMTHDEYFKSQGKENVKKPKDSEWYVIDKSDNKIAGIGKTPDLAIQNLKKVEGVDTFKSSHFDEANILAHVRLNDRTDADGKKVLFVEEIQSDWHQAGRKRGYKDGTDLKAQLRGLVDQYQALWNDKPNRDANRDEMARLASEYNKLADIDPTDVKSKAPKIGDNPTDEDLDLIVRFATSGQVPDAPFKKTWHEFALKRILKMAVDQGYERVAWTTGEQQAERYDLSKQIDNVTLTLSGDTEVLRAFDLNGNEVMSKSESVGFDWSDYIGKEAAQKLDEQKWGRKDKKGLQRKVLQNADLKVGGEGMKGFYDNILVKSADKLIKKFGGKVGEAELSTATREVYELRYTDDDGQRVSEEFATISEAREREASVASEGADATVKKIKSESTAGTKVHSLDITPQLKQAVSDQGFELFQDAKGRIRFGADKQFNIDLFKDADFSTFLHESGHFFLEVMGDLAEADGAPKQIKDDYQAILDWLGASARDQITVEHHEKWARGFEAYLMEGKAPSNRLRKAFRQFKQWLISIYRQMANLRVELSPEIRDVMSRMMATEAEIQEASERYSLEPMFSDPSAYGMTGKMAEKYLAAVDDAKMAAEEQLTAKLMDQYAKKKTKAYKEQRKRVKAEIEKQVDEMPTQKLLALLQRGKLPNGDALPEGVQAIKLDRQALVDSFGAEFVKNRLPKPFIYSRDGGIHHDIVAGMYGFESGDDMITQLANTPPRSEMVELMTNQRMAQEFTDLLADERELEAEAVKAIHTDKRAELKRLEMEHLYENYLPLMKEVTRRTIRRMPSDVQMREQARKIIGGRAIRDLKPYKFLAAEKKASRDAALAFTRGEYDAAYTAKERELLNHYLFTESLAAKDQVKKSLNNFKKIWRKDDELAKSRDMNFVNAARAVLSEFGLGRREKPAAEYLNELRQYDPDGYETIKALVDDAIAGAGPYKQVRIDEFNEMSDAVMGLWQMSKQSKEITIEGRKMAKQQAIDDLSATVTAISQPKAKPGYNKKVSQWDKFKLGLAGFGSILRRVEQWSDAMDMGEADGAFKKYIFNPVSEATTQYRLKKRELMQQYLEMVKAVEKTITREPINATELNYEFEGKQELLGALLHVGNQSNKRKLLLGYGWASLNADGSINSSRWDNFIKRMHDEGVLVKADWDFIQNVWNLFESVKPEAQKAHYDMYGHYFSEITRDVVSTPFGEYAGGYAPAIANSELATDQMIREDREALEKSNNSFMFPTAGRGFTKSRVDQYVAPLIMDLSLVPRHIDKVTRFAYIEPRIKDVGRIVFDKGFRSVLDGFDQTVASEMLVPWLQRSAQQQVEIPSKGRGWRFLDNAFKTLRRNTGLNIMTANVLNTLQQVTGLSVGMLEVNRKHLRNALWAYVRSPKEYAADVAEKSQFMSTRVTTSVIEVQTHIDELLMNPSKYDKLRDFAQKHGYFLQSGAQNVVDVIVWGGRYDQAVQEGMSEADAVRAADRAVRASQGSFNPEDMSAFEIGSPMFRAFTMFYSYFNMLANVNVSKFQQITRDMGVKKGAGRLLYVYVFGMMIPAVLAEAISKAGAGDFDEDDDDEYLDDAMALFFGSQFRMLTAMVPYVGQLGNTAVNMWNDKPFDDKVSVSPAIGMLESTVRSPVSIYEAIAEDKSKKKAAKDFLTAVGLLTGVPVLPLSKPIGYLIDVEEGNANPSGPIDFTRGLITGRPGDN